jgi:uncharacterized membrane protein
MRKAIGVVLIVVSVLLFVKGYDVAHSVASQVKQVFAGVPVDGAVHLYLAGAVAGLLGLVLIFWKK